MASLQNRITRLEMQREAIITPPENETPMQQYLRLINEPCAAPSKTCHMASYTPEEAYKRMIGA